MNVKAILCVSLISMLLVIVPVMGDADAAGAEITPMEVKGTPGDSISVDFMLSGNPGLWGLGFDIAYPDFLEFVSVSNGSLFAVTPGDSNKNPYRFYGESNGFDNITGNGKLISISFKIKTDATFGTGQVTLSNVDGIDCNGDDVEVNLNSSTVTVAKSVKSSFIGGSESTGTAPETIMAFEGDEITIPENTFVKANHTFAGWSNGGDVYQAGDKFIMPSSDVSMIAIWKINQYSVKFVNHDQSLVGESVCDYGSVIIPPTETPVRASTVDKTYSFSKWAGYTDGMKVTGDHTFVAEFTESVRMYKVTFMSEGEIFSTSEQSYGSEVKLPVTNPVKQSDQENDYVFQKWAGYVAGMKVSGEHIFTADFKTVGIVYTITYKSEGKVFAEQQYGLGDLIVLPGTAPFRDSTADKVFTFTKWNGYTSGMTVSGDATFDAVFTESARTYNVVFKNGDQVLQTLSVEYGKTPVYTGNTPVKAADAQYTYAFKEWGPEITQVSGDAVYQAVFDKTVNKYEVKWMNGTSVFKTETLEYGATIIAPSDVPAKESTKEKTYAFSKWAGFTTSMKVDGNESFDAVFNESARMYKVVFMSEGKVFETSEQAYGAAVRLPVSNPVKASDASNNYIFEKWAGYTDGMKVFGEHTFTAQFKIVEIVYTITYKSEGKVFAEQQYGAGDLIVLPVTEPVKESTKEKDFSFSGWNGYTVGMKVTSNATFDAMFSDSPRMYDVVFMNGDSVHQNSTLPYGAVIVAPVENPVLEGHVFSGWNGFVTGMTVSGEHVFTALFGELPVFKVMFMVGESVHATYGVKVGYPIAVPEDPVLEGHIFKGWDYGVFDEMPSYDLIVNAKMEVIPEVEKHDVAVDDRFDESHMGAINDAEAGEIISVRPSGDRLEVDAGMVGTMAGKDVDFEVVVGDVFVRYSNEVLDGLGASGIEVGIKENPTDMNRQQSDVVGDRHAISLELSSGGSKITDLGGKATINLHYILREGQTVDNVTVFCVAEDGTVSERNTWYDSRSSNIFFETETHSIYYIGESEPSSSGGMDMTMIIVGAVAAVVVVAVAAVLLLKGKS